MKGYTGSKTNPVFKDCWQTPPQIFDYLNIQYNFTLDAAASDSNHLCSNYYTEADNSLEQPWSKSTWCNPPYSNLTPWVDKAVLEQSKGNLSVLLIPADTSVKWFQTAFDNCTSCTFLTGRIAFIHADSDKPISGNNKGSVIFEFDPSQKTREVHLLERDLLMAG